VTHATRMFISYAIEIGSCGRRLSQCPSADIRLSPMLPAMRGNSDQWQCVTILSAASTLSSHSERIA
jgi:hypothetical protein